MRSVISIFNFNIFPPDPIVPVKMGGPHYRTMGKWLTV